MFSPQGYPNGKVIYDMSLSPIDEQQRSLYDLEPFRQTFVVLALTNYRDNSDMDYEKQVKELKKQFPGSICHKVLVFGVPDAESVTQSKNVLPVLSSKAQVTNIETVMTDITTDFLAELAVFTISKQLGSLESPGIKELETPATVSRPGDKPYNVSLRRGMVKHSPSASSISLSRQSSVSKTGSISIGPSERTKSKQRGRQLKYTGNMYLLAGRYPDALKSLSEAATILKGAYDHLWFASTLDAIGICLVLQSFLEVPVTIPAVALQATYMSSSGSEAHFSPSSSNLKSDAASSRPSTPSAESNSNPSGAGSGALSPSGEHAATAAAVAASKSSISLPSSHSPSPNLNDFLPELVNSIMRYFSRSQSSTEENVPQLVYCETMLRFVKLLVATRIAGGWNLAMLSSVVRGTPIDKHITNGSVPTTVIAYWCNRIYSTDLTNMPILVQCNIYSGIASAYSSIGLVRKRTFILRELLVNLVPKIIKSRRQRQQLEQENVKPESGFLTLLDGVQEKGILELLDMLCQVFGAGDVRAAGCGWSDLKVSFLRTCISICEAIPDMGGIIYYTSLLLSTSADVLTKDEQKWHYQNIHKSLDTARQLGRGDIAAEYWDSYLVRDIWVTPASSTVPIEQVPKKGDHHGQDQEDGVFLYNPYQGKEGDIETQVLVQNERAEFVVKLQNPFAFEVQVSELSLITEGPAELVASATNVYIPPSSMYELLLPAVAQSHGVVKILGCRVQMAGCTTADYFLYEKDIPLEQKIKQVGISSGSFSPSSATVTKTRKHVEMRVVPAEPIMALKAMNLNRGWLMLLEGENHEFTLTLSNISDVPVNLVQLKFLDSTSEPLQQAMHNKELALNEVYECEYFLYNRRALTWVNSDDNKVEPHQTGSFQIRVNGKRGMTNATINIDYSNQMKTDSSVWTRRLSVPINVTVNSSIELGGCDIIPLQAAFKKHECYGTEEQQISSPSTPLAKFMQSLEPSDLGKYCVVVADIRNSWSQPMTVTMWSTKSSDDPSGAGDEDQHNIEMTETIYPNRLKRFLLPVRWDPISPEKADQEIPLRSRKQYVVDPNMTKEQARFMREAFWSREQLLRQIGGTWKTHDSPPRTGFVELRGLRLSQKMVNVLRLEQVQMTMSLRDCEGLKSLNDTTSEIKCDEPASLVTVITNRSPEPISGMLRLVPSARYYSQTQASTSGQASQNHQYQLEDDEINRKLLYNGVLQRPVFDIPPGEHVEIKLGFVFVARGEYEWSSIFETSNRGPNRLQQHGQRQPIYVKVV